MPAVSVSERVERAQRVLARVLGFCAVPEDDAEYDRVRDLLRQAHRLALVIDAVAAHMQVLRIGGSYHHLGINAVMKNARRSDFGRTVSGTRFLDRLKEDFDFMVKTTTSIDREMYLSGFDRNRNWHSHDLVALNDIVDFIFDLAERFEELRDSEIVRRALTTA